MQLRKCPHHVFFFIRPAWTTSCTGPWLWVWNRWLAIVFLESIQLVKTKGRWCAHLSQACYSVRYHLSQPVTQWYLSQACHSVIWYRSRLGLYLTSMDRPSSGHHRWIDRLILYSSHRANFGNVALTHAWTDIRTIAIRTGIRTQCVYVIQK